jgi:hypothetical protein
MKASFHCRQQNEVALSHSGSTKGQGLHICSQEYMAFINHLPSGHAACAVQVCADTAQHISRAAMLRCHPPPPPTHTHLLLQ